MFATYDEWRSKKVEALEDETVDCPDCEGSGLVYSRCGCCGGSEKESECARCDGSGSIEFSSLMAYEDDELIGLDVFKNEVFCECARLACWYGIALHEAMFRAGLCPFSAIEKTPEGGHALDFQIPKKVASHA